MSLIAPQINKSWSLLLCGTLMLVLLSLHLWLQELSTSRILTALPSVKGRRAFLISPGNLFWKMFCWCKIRSFFLYWKLLQKVSSLCPDFSVGSNIISFKVLLFPPPFFSPPLSLNTTEFLYLRWRFHFHNHCFFNFVTLRLSLLLERTQDFQHFYFTLYYSSSSQNQEIVKSW